MMRKKIVVATIASGIQMYLRQLHTWNGGCLRVPMKINLVRRGVQLQHTLSLQKKKLIYLRTKSVCNSRNPQVNQHYPQIFHGKKIVCNVDAGNLPTKYKSVGNNSSQVIPTNTSPQVKSIHTLPTNCIPWVNSQVMSIHEFK